MVSLRLVLDKIKKKLTQDSGNKELKGGNITVGQHGFMGNKSCQTNLISFFDEMRSLVEET